MSGERILYWDSCCFIHLFGNTPEYFTALDEIRSRAKNKECKILTSAASLAEVCKIPDTGKLPIAQTRQILQFFENDYVELWQVDRDVGEQAHHIIRDHDLLPMDAIHLATAMMAKPEMVLTTDSKKYRRKGLLPWDGKIGKPPLSIKKPDISIHLPLWGMSISPVAAIPAASEPAQSNPDAPMVEAQKATIANGKTQDKDGQIKPQSDSTIIRKGSGGPALGPAEAKAQQKEQTK